MGHVREQQKLLTSSVIAPTGTPPLQLHSGFGYVTESCFSLNTSRRLVSKFAVKEADA